MEKMDFKDKTITCLDCKQDFPFTAGEQEFYWTKSLAVPKRCKRCRQIRRRTIDSREREVSHENGE